MPQTVYMAPMRLMGALAVGAALSTGVAVSESRPCAGVARFRVRFKATVAGTLSVSYQSPDGGTDYTTPAATTAAVVANTEVAVDLTPSGEAFAKVMFTPSGNGVVTFCDVCGL